MNEQRYFVLLTEQDYASYCRMGQDDIPWFKFIPSSKIVCTIGEAYECPAIESIIPVINRKPLENHLDVLIWMLKQTDCTDPELIRSIRYAEFSLQNIYFFTP